MDSIGKTITNEVVLMVMRIALTLGLILMYITDRLNFATFLHLQNAILIIFLLLLLCFATKYFSGSKNSKSVKETAKEFKDYSIPLFWASTVSVITVFADRGLLQMYGGAAAQGYYSLGFAVGGACFLLTGSFTPLLAREYAIAYEKQDTAALRHLFSKYVPLFYVLTATIACFPAVHGDWLALLIGGDSFSEAALPVMLLCLAPLHQTYGQISGSLMTATDRTREYSGISIFMAILGLPITYVVLAPDELNFGLNLGATGLALKLVVLQILGVNIQLWFNTRQLGISINRFIHHQIIVTLLFLFIGFIFKSLVSIALGNGVVALITSGVLYLVLIFTIVLLFPGLVSMNRSELYKHMRTASSFFK